VGLGRATLAEGTGSWLPREAEAFRRRLDIRSLTCSGFRLPGVALRSFLVVASRRTSNSYAHLTAKGGSETGERTGSHCKETENLFAESVNAFVTAEPDCFRETPVDAGVPPLAAHAMDGLASSTFPDADLGEFGRVETVDVPCLHFIEYRYAIIS
jgi:hypothetical protein